MRFGQHGASVRIVMDLSAEADFRAMAQNGPRRIIIDTPMLSGQPLIRRSDLPGMIRDIRLEPLGDAHSRMTFVLDKPAIIRSAFLMPRTGDKPARLVVDISPVSEENFIKQIDRPYGTLLIADSARGLPFAGTATAKLDAISKPKEPGTPDITAPEGPALRPLIMIDAGHGGQDPGASGTGVKEKDVTLAVARTLRSILEATGKYRVEMTRERDVFVRLPERVKIARKAGADLFVSIHADSVSGGFTSAQGASVYTLSARASDAQAASLAARENKADLLSGLSLPDEDADVANILIDLTTRETARQSRRFAGDLIESFEDSKIHLVEGPRRAAGFLVLKAPDIPSVLVELGFLSNPDEVKKLADNGYRMTIGKAIADGIDTWLKDQKP